jgi:hypothetical protein
MENRIMSRYLIVVSALVLLAACSDAPESPVPVVDADSPARPVYDEEAIKQQAAQALLPFKQQLMQALQRGLEQGPAQAIDVCRLQAPAIAAAASVDGVTIGRTSFRLRNPGNAPSVWQQVGLRHYQQSEDREPMLIDLENGQMGYMEPIVTAPMCLACHGSELSVEVKDALAKHYPADQATGFAAGDLRGIFWVSLPVTDQVVPSP